MFMSAPSLIAKAAIDLFSSGEIYNDLYISGIELFWGYLLSAAVAIPFGIMVGWYKKMSYIFDPFINAMNATPRVALLPLVIIWLGIGILSKVGIIFLGAVFPILINSRDGVKTTPLNLLTAARSFGASEWMIFKAVVLPSTIPFILSGLRQGLGRAIVGVMVGELYAATAGIGFMITVAGATFQTDKVFVGVLVFALTGMIGTEILANEWKNGLTSGVPKSVRWIDRFLHPSQFLDTKGPIKFGPFVFSGWRQPDAPCNFVQVAKPLCSPLLFHAA